MTNSNPQVDALLNDLSALDDELLTLSEQADQSSHTTYGSRAYKTAADKVRAVIEKHRIEPEFEWGVKYENFDEQILEHWGYSRDPRLPFKYDNGAEGSPAITEDGVIYIGNDGFFVKAVSKRIKTKPEGWEAYEA